MPRSTSVTRGARPIADHLRGAGRGLGVQRCAGVQPDDRFALSSEDGRLAVGDPREPTRRLQYILRRRGWRRQRSSTRRSGGGGGGGGFRQALMIVRGGFGEFRAPTPQSLFSSLQSQNGEFNAETQLYCVGPQVPTPDWEGFANGEGSPTDLHRGRFPRRHVGPRCSDRRHDLCSGLRSATGVARLAGRFASALPADHRVGRWDIRSGRRAIWRLGSQSRHRARSSVWPTRPTGQCTPFPARSTRAQGPRRLVRPDSTRSTPRSCRSTPTCNPTRGK